jgi:UDP-N-acetylglucosamine:LPS N-acetylglucosamine transferase
MASDDPIDMPSGTSPPPVKGDCSRRPRVNKLLAVASGGGHWVQLLRLRPAFEGQDVTWATVDARYQSDVPGQRLWVFPDATRWNKLRLVRQILRLAWIILRVRPDVIVTTGAAPGFVAIRIGKLLRARSIWLDSIANVDALSLSGQQVGPHADLWLTQWAHLARPDGPRYEGAVL